MTEPPRPLPSPSRWLVVSAVAVGIAPAVVLSLPALPSIRGLIVGAALIAGNIVGACCQFLAPRIRIREGAATAVAMGTLVGAAPVGFSIGPLFFPAMLLWYLVFLRAHGGQEPTGSKWQQLATAAYGAVIGAVAMVVVLYLALTLAPLE